MLIYNQGREKKGEKRMTDSEKLDMIIEKLSSLEREIKDIKRQEMKYVAELKAMDSMIFDEVERVHEILYKHIEDKKKHTA